jgi:hypothetical protein
MKAAFQPGGDFYGSGEAKPRRIQRTNKKLPEIPFKQRAI